jgi:hypothetical protein
MTLAPAREHPKKEIKLMNKETTAEQTAGTKSSITIFRVRCTVTQRWDDEAHGSYTPEEEIKRFYIDHTFHSVNDALTNIQNRHLARTWSWDWVPQGTRTTLCYSRTIRKDFVWSGDRKLSTDARTTYCTYTIEPEEIFLR